VNREQVLALLVKLRDGRLRKAVAELKEETGVLRRIEKTSDDAVCATRESGATQIRDLGLFGEVRLRCISLSREVNQRVLLLGQRVTHSYKLTQSARAAHSGIVRKKLAAQELSHERDVDSFFSWKRTGRR
jgi:hypothetical protein